MNVEDLNLTRFNVLYEGGRYIIVRRINGAPQVVAECRTSDFANMVLIALQESAEGYPAMRHTIRKMMEAA